MGRSRCCWLSWWTELALIEQAETKNSKYAAGSLLTVADLPLVEVAAILAATDRIERMSGADRVRMLAGRRIALLFYESSTRTRTSFELAAKSLGAITTLVSDKSSSIEKGESLKDTGLTLRALGAECIILRHANSGAPYLLAKATGLPVLNAGDGMHEHPSQALLDLRTILARLPGVDGGRGNSKGNSKIDAKTLAGVTVVVHAAALKQVPACEYNPFEAIQTNIMGGRNVIDAALDQGVRRILALSTDKAVNPINLYGATKLCAEKVFVQANAYAGARNTRFSCARYGNVVGSRGSVIPVFLEQRRRGKITITDPRMTRFWLTLEQGVKFVIRCLEQMHGGEIFVPKIPSMRLLDLAETIAPGCQVEYIGIRPGEKLHEVLVSEDESRQTLETEDMFVIQPSHPWWKSENWVNAKPLPEGFRYSSDTNDRWLTRRQLEELVAREASAAEAVPTSA